MMGAFAHTTFIPLFWWYGYPFLAALNIASATAWTASWKLSRQKRRNFAVNLIAIEASLHATLATIITGQESAFQFYLIPLSCLVLICPDIDRWKAGLLGVIGMALFLSLSAPPSHGWFATTSRIPEAVAIINMGISVATMAGFAIIIRSMYEAQERNLTWMASRDTLTGLYNRRFTSDYLQQLAERQKRSPFSCCLALIDIDHFKTINDHYGHDAGDTCLVELAQTLTGHFRTSDIVCRWGGEEFVLVFPDASVQQIVPAINVYRQRLHQHPVVHGTLRIPVTLSAGVTALVPGEDFDTAINRADHLLYRAKAAGRDRVFSEPACDDGGLTVGEERIPRRHAGA